MQLLLPSYNLYILIMKKSTFFVITFLVLISSFSSAQKKYIKLNFDDTTAANAPDCQFKANGSDFHFALDESVFLKNKRSLNIFCGICHPGFNGMFQFVLPGFTGGKVSKIVMKGDILTEGSLNSGFWCKVKNEKQLVGYANTIKRIAGFPEALDCDYTGINEPPVPYNWDSKTLEINVQGGYATSIMFGGFVISGKAWFDNFEIYIDGKKINNILIPAENFENN